MASELEVGSLKAGASSTQTTISNAGTLTVNANSGAGALVVSNADGSADIVNVESGKFVISSTGLATFSAGITVSGGFLSLDTPTELTIVESNSIGAVTATRSFHDVDTEGDAATDDLDTINGGSAGDILTLKILTSTRNVTVKDATGNLRLAGDFTLTSPNDIITLIKYSTVWIETSRSDNV